MTDGERAREKARELIANKCPHWAHTVNQIMRSHCEECIADALLEARRKGLEEAAKVAVEEGLSPGVGPAERIAQAIRDMKGLLP
mgnify:CR=1 FL=1